MNALVRTKVTIKETASGDLEIEDFLSLTVRQHVFGLNSYELHVDETVIEGKDPDFMKKSAKLIGKKTSITITPENESSVLIFTGIVTNVSQHNDIGASSSTTVIKAESPEVLLSYGIKKKVFNEMSVKDIVQKVTATYPSSHIDLNNQAFGLATSAKKTFIQYSETDYQFLQRLANITGNWFYHNGKSLNFGKAPDGDAVQLNLGENLFFFEVSAKVGGIQHEAEVYSPNDDNSYSNKTTKASGTDTLTSSILSESEQSFSNKNSYHAPGYLNTPELLSKYLEVRYNQQVAEVNTVSGSSCAMIRIADKVNIKRNNVSIGEYRIVSLEIMLDAIGNFSNQFTGIAYSPNAPRTIFASPSIPSEMKGRVVAVNDPDGHGKLKVKFDWQGDDQYYGWIQVSSPSAGDDSGFYFRPEVDSWVAVHIDSSIGLEGSYIIGALHHGNAQPRRWKNKDNHIKGFKTPAGNEVLLEDKGKDGKAISIQTSDDDGNYFWIKDSDGATEIYLRSKVIKLMAENDLEISAGGKLTLQGTDVKISSGKTNVSKDSATQSSAMAVIELKMAGDVKVDSKASFDVSAMTGVKISSNTNFSATANASMEISGTATTTLKSSGVLTIQGTMVKIN